MGDIRWKQRLDIYQKALAQLSEFLAQESLNKFEVQGLIQCFEYTFELGWKTIKDYLEQEGLDVKTPRSAIQTAFHTELIRDGHVWIDMLEKRNLMAHSSNPEYAIQAERLIREKYAGPLKELGERLES
jgi:nucleotidyltransferase substrate binding protein (TIGR01987 family)